MAPIPRPEFRTIFVGPRAAALWLAAYFLFQTISTASHLPDASPLWLIMVTGVAVRLGYMFFALAMLVSLASVLAAAPRAVAALAGGLVVWWLFARVLHPPPVEQRLALAVYGTALDMGRALGAVGIGGLVAGMIRDRNILLPAAVFAAFADFLTVYTRIGTVNQALQTPQGQKLIASMSSHVAAPHAKIALLSVGMADYVFLAIFFACAIRFAMNLGGTFLALFVTLSLSLLFVVYVSAIPGLAPMALAFVAVNFRHFRLSRSELQAMGVAFGIVLALVAALFLLHPAGKPGVTPPTPRRDR